MTLPLIRTSVVLAGEGLPSQGTRNGTQVLIFDSTLQNIAALENGWYKVQLAGAAQLVGWLRLVVAARFTRWNPWYRSVTAGSPRRPIHYGTDRNRFLTMTEQAVLDDCAPERPAPQARSHGAAFLTTAARIATERGSSLEIHLSAEAHGHAEFVEHGGFDR